MRVTSRITFECSRNTSCAAARTFAMRTIAT